MDILFILLYGIPAGILYLVMISYIWDNIDFSAKINIYRNRRIKLKTLKRNLKNLLKDDDKHCIREKILMGIDDYYDYKRCYGRKYLDRAEEELWEFLLNYIDKDKLFIEEL